MVDSFNYSEEVKRCTNSEAFEKLKTKAEVYATVSKADTEYEKMTGQAKCAEMKAEAEAAKLQAEADEIAKRVNIDAQKAKDEMDILRIKANAEAKSMEMKAEAELIRAKAETNKPWITGAEVATIASAVITGLIGIWTLYSNVKSTQLRCEADMNIANEANRTKKILTNQLTKANETELIIDKPIKVYNELSR